MLKFLLTAILTISAYNLIGTAISLRTVDVMNSN